MRRTQHRRTAALLLVATLALGACNAGGDEADGDGTPSPSPSPTSPSSGSATATPGATGEPSGGSGAGPSPVGSSQDPQALDAGRDLLAWKPVPGSVQDTVTRAGDATLSVDEAGTRAKLTAKGVSTTVTATSRQRVSDALLDERWAVVVLADKQDERPATATVVDLRTGERSTIDGSSAVPTVNGGTWALGGDRLLHPTVDRGAYCVASLDLAAGGPGERSWCAPARTGFNAARITPAGVSLLTFDDHRPVACRTAVELDGDEVTPLPGVPDCQAWESLLLPDGAVWTVIPDEHKVGQARVYAHTGGSWLDLGPATSSTLTWCGDAAYFVRDPQRDGAPAALMRWRPTGDPADGLDVVYESPGGQAFLSAPRCGGDTITVTAFAQAGDEQVSAPVG